MSKKIKKKCVHINHDATKKDENDFAILLNLKNKQLAIAQEIYPDFKPKTINVKVEIGEYLKSKIMNPKLSVADAARLSGYEMDYSELIELDANVNTVVLGRFGRYINFYKNTFIAAIDDFKEKLNEQHSIYISNPKAIELYEKTEKFISIWNELVDESFLTDKENLSWRLSNAFHLVRVAPEKGTILEPNYIKIKQYMDV